MTNVQIQSYCNALVRDNYNFQISQKDISSTAESWQENYLRGFSKIFRTGNFVGLP